MLSNSEKCLSLLQVNGKCPNFSHSRLKRLCSAKWIENYDAVFVFKEFCRAVIGSLDQLSESRDRKVLRRATSYLKAITTPGFLISLRSYQCFTEIYQNSCKEAAGHQEIILTALDAMSITSYKDMIRTFRDNKKIFV